MRPQQIVNRVAVDGVVASRAVEPGAVVGAGTALLSVVDLSRMEMLGAAPHTDPDTGHAFDDTKRYVDKLALSPEDRYKLFEGNARRELGPDAVVGPGVDGVVRVDLQVHPLDRRGAGADEGEPAGFGKLSSVSIGEGALGWGYLPLRYLGTWKEGTIHRESGE